MAKALIFDIETSPLVAHVWQTRVRKAYISNENILIDTRIISFSAKWLNGRGIAYRDIRGRINDAGEKSLLKDLWGLMNEADMVIAHNGKAFDVPSVFAKFAAYDIPPPEPSEFYDTCLAARKYFKFTSNSLEYLARALGCPIQKHRHGKFPGMSLWQECLKDNVAAWNEMRIYNKTDIEVLEWVYNKLRPYDDKHPNIANINGMNGCPKCGKPFLVKAGVKYAKTLSYDRYRCTKCGSWTTDTRARKTLDGVSIRWSPK